LHDNEVVKKKSLPRTVVGKGSEKDDAVIIIEEMIAAKNNDNANMIEDRRH